jgi:hypothetical protein
MSINLTKIQPTSYIKRAFKARGIRIGYLTKHRLSYFPEQTYSEILGLVDKASAIYKIDRFKIGPFNKNSDVEFEKIPTNVLSQYIITKKSGEILDLRNIKTFRQLILAKEAKEEYVGKNELSTPLSHEDKVRQLLNIIAEERTYLQHLAEGKITIEDLSKVLIHGVEKFLRLGFHATILRPIEINSVSLAESHWYESYRAEKWGEGSYSWPEGKIPENTLRSVIRNKDSKFKVNLEDPTSFINIGLEYGPEKIDFDLTNSKGSPEFLIFKLESIKGPESVIYINNRVSKEKLETPSHNLFPPKDANFLEEELNSYFDQITQMFNLIRNREKTLISFNREKAYLSAKEKSILLKCGQLLKYLDLRIRLFEVPSEKFYRNLEGTIEWLRDVIISVYDGTKIAEGKTKEELIKMLSLEDEKMLERVIYVRYLALIEGNSPNEHDLKGIVSGTVLNINDEKPLSIFKVPEAMIRRMGRGKKMEVALTSEMAKKVYRKEWIDKGFIKGFWYMLFKGLPFYATTQSLRVCKDMMRLKNLSIIRLAKGKELFDEQKRVIKTLSQGKADERGIEFNTYGGRITIDEEEKRIIFKKPFIFFNLPIIRRIFKRYIEKIKKEDEKIKQLVKEAGEKGRIHLIGYFTLGVALKIGLELFLASLFRMVISRNKVSRP